MTESFPHALQFVYAASYQFLKRSYTVLRLTDTFCDLGTKNVMLRLEIDTIFTLVLEILVLFILLILFVVSHQIQKWHALIKHAPLTSDAERIELPMADHIPKAPSAIYKHLSRTFRKPLMVYVVIRIILILLRAAFIIPTHKQVTVGGEPKKVTLSQIF